MGAIAFGALLGAVVPILLGLFATIVNKFELESMWAWLAVLPLAIISAVAGALISIFITLWAAIAAGPIVIVCAYLFMYWYGRLDRR